MKKYKNLVGRILQTSSDSLLRLAVVGLLITDFFIDFIESHFLEFTSFCHSPNFCECCFCSYFVLFQLGFLRVVLSDGF